MPWPVHPNGLLAAGASGDNDTYQISRSLRFNSADSAYLNRTPASAGNRNIWTLNLWVKKSSSGFQNIFGTSSTGNSNNSLAQVYFDSSDRLGFFQYNSTTTYTDLVSTRVFRDYSAWYMLTFQYDDTQATSSNRVKLYVNGEQITSFASSSYPTQNFSGYINLTNIHYLARDPQASPQPYFGGYLTEINFIDGQALTPSSFGETDSITGRWKAKAYSGTYGTNGFYLKFSDNSSLTTTSNVGIGKDFSGNTNYWATNGISITAGAGNDSLVDSPTNYGSDSYSTSVDNARGCYCTLNPIHLAGATLSNGNLSATCPTGTTYYFARGTFAIPQTGKWYWETTITTVGLYPVVGVVAATNQEVSASDSYVGKTTNSAGWFGTIDAIYVNGSVFVSSLPPLSNGDVIMCAVSDNKVYLGRNGTWANSGNPIAGTGSVLTATADLIPAITVRGTPTAPVLDLNFGQRPFAYTAPAGFKALCTTNLTTPTIKKPSTAMDVLTYTGTGASQSISSLGFSPDLVWIKGRSGATDHALYDVIRGSQARLESNNTDAEVTSDNGLTSFDSAGFTVGTLAQVNTNTATYVGWSWDAGSTNSTNTSGSITSTVRANAQAGFSIVSYTGTGANATVGHGLGVAPKMVIVKGRDSQPDHWYVYHASVGATKYMRLNTTNAEASSSLTWNNTAPTASVFSISTDSGVNQNTKLFIAYLFAEIEGYSKFGSYTGNGSSDGPFVWCGFRPRWVMIKRSDASSTYSHWYIIDSSRNPYNIAFGGSNGNNFLKVNGSDPENYYNYSTNDGGSFPVDFLSNGFKYRLNNSGGDVNASGGTYIFAAFAEAPFKYARAR